MNSVLVRSLMMLKVTAILFCSSVAHADKIDSIQKAMRDECHQKVNSQKALTLIRPLYLTCVPGTKVQVGTCDVKCLKHNSGVILGRE